MSRILEKSGHTVTTAQTGTDALKLAQESLPDVIILDWNLETPECMLSGEDVLRQLKSESQTNRVPIIVYSGIQQQAEDEAQACRAGAHVFLDKVEICSSPDIFLRRLDAILINARLDDAGGRRSRRPSPPDQSTILLIENDPESASMLSRILKDEGHSVLQASDGKSGLSLVLENRISLVILDLGLPDMNGLEVCSRLKSDNRTRDLPVMLLTDRDSNVTRQLALQHRADHYLRKPITNSDEFRGYIHALLRRQPSPLQDMTLRLGDVLTMDAQNRTATFNGKVISPLPLASFKLLYELAKHAGQVLPHEYLIDRVWNNRIKRHSLEMAICRLKTMLGPGSEEMIECVRGIGYRLSPIKVGRTPPASNS
jgi:DNA-binding response OmpR family regulator